MTPFQENSSQSQNIDRLNALAAYDIVDTAAEAEFDALTRLASHIANTPIALITLLDNSRQWFKSNLGLTLKEVQRHFR